MSLIRYPVKSNFEPEYLIKMLELFFGYRPMGVSRIQACKTTASRCEKNRFKVTVANTA